MVSKPATYLGSIFRLYNKQNTQQQIQNKIIELAKDGLVKTELSVSEIACELVLSARRVSANYLR